MLWVSRYWLQVGDGFWHMLAAEFVGKLASQEEVAHVHRACCCGRSAALQPLNP